MASPNDDHSTTFHRVSNDKSMLERHLDVPTPFDAANDHFRALRLRATVLCDALNSEDVASRQWRAHWKELTDPENKSSTDQGPPRVKGSIHIDYGPRVKIHPSCFINRGCIIVDNPIHNIEVGEHTLIAPNVTIASISHPIDWRKRNGQLGPSLAAGVKVGKHCFIGANVVILPGVEIGDGCVIGASSVVTHSMPAYHVVVGHPARATRKVASDVPNAPGLRYELDGMTVLSEQRRAERDRDKMLASMGKCLTTMMVLACAAVLMWLVFRPKSIC